MQFTKIQSTGNDFILFEAADADPKDWSELAVEMCNRHFGIGADGVLLLLPSDKADIRMVIYNADGSEAEACGNGLRAIVYYAFIKGIIKTEKLSVETLGGVRQAKVIVEDNGDINIKVSMGKPIFDADLIPIAAEEGKGKLLDIKLLSDYPLSIDGEMLKLSFVSMGNPHAIHFIEGDVNKYPLKSIGPKVEHNALFPKRTNFEIARVKNRGEIDVRVWERGVGETLACGSGVCAVAVAAQCLGLADKSIDINIPGGKLCVTWDNANEVYLSGPSEIVFEGNYLK